MWNKVRYEQKNDLMHECFKSKKILKYVGDKTFVQGDTSKAAKLEFQFQHISPVITVKKQKYIMITTDFIGSVGGSLSLFLGFSLFTYASEVMDKLLAKIIN